MVDKGLRREVLPDSDASGDRGVPGGALRPIGSSPRSAPGTARYAARRAAVWTCNICRAVWTESSNGYCLGRALTPDEMESEGDRLVREIFSERPFPRGCGIDETEFQAEVEIYAKAFITTYRELLASKASSSPVLGVHQENHDRVHFLMIDED